jgi:hypothetical protein
MRESYSWDWVEARVAEASAAWRGCAGRSMPAGPEYSEREHTRRERAYDRALRDVEREAKRAPVSRRARLRAQRRTVKAFAGFAAAALDLEDDAIELLTHEFLPVGTGLAQWARQFDPALSMADIIQACRNAWTACGLQPLLGRPVQLTPSILGYSLIYPYSDNFLDQQDVNSDEKRRFSARFRERLRLAPEGSYEQASGARPNDASAHAAPLLAACGLPPEDEREARLWALVGLVEQEYLRAEYPQVYESMLAIHRAQEGSIAQVGSVAADADLLRMSCAKGGTSVLADACMARGWLSEEESRFAFAWGVLLQLGDDLQDVRDDLRRGSVTLFSRAAAEGRPLDALTRQLLNFAERVGAWMDALPHGSPMLKRLLHMSWRSLIVGAVADSHMYFTPEFLREAERASAFRFGFLRERRERLASHDGLYRRLFEAFLESEGGALAGLPSPQAAADDVAETMGSGQVAALAMP